MSGALIAEYILREKAAKNELPQNPAIIETIVTTAMLKAVAKEYGAALIEVLTGFKYIGEQIKLFEQDHSHHYVFGMEESYGCLAGTYARDKDACVAVMMLCEVAAYYKLQGKTLCDAMEEMYQKYGYYQEGLATVTKKGMDGAQQIQDLMAGQRKNPPKELGGGIKCSVSVITRKIRLQIWRRGRSPRQGFQLPMSFTMNWKIMHGAVSAHPAQNQKLNIILA